jgi:hypothetical protein
MRSTIVTSALWTLLAVALAGCDASGSITAAQVDDPTPLADTACVSPEPVFARAPSGGTAVFSVVPEGLPEGAEIVAVPPCPNTVRPGCSPGETPLYYIPCAAVGPNLCSQDQQFWPACEDTGRCPSNRDTVLVRAGIGVCSNLPSIPRNVWATIRCPDGTEVERRATLFVTVPGDCNEDGRVTADEIDIVIRAVFDTQAEQCDADLNLDGRVTPDELQKVVTIANRRATTGENCVIPEGTPTPDPGVP